MLRNLHRCLAEHQVSRGDAEQRADYLRCDVSRHLLPGNSSLACVRERHCRIEMRPGNRAEGVNQRDQRCASGKRIRKQRNCDVSAAQALAHDARTYDRGQEQRGPEHFSDKATERRHGRFVDFVARTKALMNLPSTNGAIASTSRPSPARNCRASSML